VSERRTEAVGAARLVDRFTAVADRLSGVHIENRDALGLITSHDRPDAVIYCDPPYLGSTRAGRARRDTSTDYATT
jgi:DNA adenine methylase